MPILITQLTFYIHIQISILNSQCWSLDFLKTRSTKSLPNISKANFVYCQDQPQSPSERVFNIFEAVKYFRFRNCKLAFETADLRLGITPLLDVCDVARDNRRDARARCAPDRLSILTYVSLFHHKFTHDARVAADSGISSPSPESGDSSR